MGPMDQLLGPKSRVGVPGPTWACSCLLIVHLTPQDTSILAGTLLIFHFLTLSLSPHLSATVGFRIITKRAVSPPPANSLVKSLNQVTFNFPSSLLVDFSFFMFGFQENGGNRRLLF
jgi:hypothetical protein